MDHLLRTVPTCAWFYTWMDQPRTISTAWLCHEKLQGCAQQKLAAICGQHKLSNHFVLRAAETEKSLTDL